MNPLTFILFVLVAAAGTAVVLTRELAHQTIVFILYGLLLSLLFLVLQAPDVALSEITVARCGFAAYPAGHGGQDTRT